MIAQGLYVVDSRDHDGPIMSGGVAGSLLADVKEGKIIWRRSVLEDEATVLAAKQLGKNIVKAINSINK